jgi:hypothetical protein
MVLCFLHPQFCAYRLYSFLEGPKAALTASKDFEGGHYTSLPRHGLKAFARVYSAWPYGQAVREYPFLFTFVVVWKVTVCSGSENICIFTTGSEFASSLELLQQIESWLDTLTSKHSCETLGTMGLSRNGMQTICLL